MWALFGLGLRVGLATRWWRVLWGRVCVFDAGFWGAEWAWQREGVCCGACFACLMLGLGRRVGLATWVVCVVGPGLRVWCWVLGCRVGLATRGACCGARSACLALGLGRRVGLATLGISAWARGRSIPGSPGGRGPSFPWWSPFPWCWFPRWRPAAWSLRRGRSPAAATPWS